ncbi:MAG: Holliday junction resolvase RuvX [Candidatus Eisenbacteria bacterium]
MLEICLPSNIEYLPLVDTICQAFCVWAGVPSGMSDDISMAVIEAATNALAHGNKYDESKKVRAVFEKRGCEIVFSVTDEGSGFDPGKVPSPVDECNMLKDCGRGIFIMKHVMDSVEFEQAKGGGTTIRLTKRISRISNGRILCIDYGEKRLGMALSDELGVTAQPLGKIEAENREEQIRELKKVAEERGVSEVVVGLPLTMRGDVSHAASRVTAFATDLNKHLGLPVVTWDERLSTKQGERVLIESGMRRKKRKQVVDSVAAAIILQSYLDARRNK